MSKREIWRNLGLLAGVALGLGLIGNWMEHPDEVAARRDLYLFWSGVVGMALTLVGLAAPLPAVWWAARRFRCDQARGPMALLWIAFSAICFLFLFGLRHG